MPMPMPMPMPTSPLLRAFPADPASASASSSSIISSSSTAAVRNNGHPAHTEELMRTYSFHDDNAPASAAPSARRRGRRYASQDTGTSMLVASERQQLGFSTIDDLYDQLDKQEKIRDGAQSILHLIAQDGFASSSNKLPSPGAAAALRAKVEAELYAADDRILALQTQIRASSSGTSIDSLSHPFSVPFSSPSPSASPSTFTEPLSLPPVSPNSVPAPPLPYPSHTESESLPDRIESEPAVPDVEDPESTSAARSLVLSLLQSIQDLIDDGTAPHAGSSRSAATSTYFGYTVEPRIQYLTESGNLSPALISSILELLDRLFTVLRRSTRLRYEFLGQLPFRSTVGPAHLYRNGYPNEDAANRAAMDHDVGFETDPLLDTLIRLLADNVGQEVRAKTYRLMAHLLVPPSSPFLARARTRGIDLYLCRTLTRDVKFDLERVEGLRLIRRVNELSEHTRAKEWVQPVAGGDEDGDQDRDDGRDGVRKRETRGSDTLDPDEPERWLGSHREQGSEDDLPFSPALIRTLASGVSEEKDRLRWIYLETLAELAIRHPHLVHLGDGFGVLVQAIRTGPPEYTPSLVQVLLFLMDMPSTRHYLRPGLDLEVALSPVTDVPFKKPSLYEAEVLAGVKTISVILRSWSGLLYLSMYQRTAIGSIVKALVSGTRESQEAIIQMLDELFEHAQGRGKSGRSAPAALRGLDSGSMMYAVSTAATTSSTTLPAQTASVPSGSGREETAPNASGKRGHVVAGPARPNLLEQYATLLLAIFVDAGLTDALVHLVEAYSLPLRMDESDVSSRHTNTMMLPTAEEKEAAERRRQSDVGRKAIRLLGTVMQISRRLLPLDEAVSAQSIPRLFALAAHFQAETVQPVFRRGKAFASLRKRELAVHRNGYWMEENGALSVGGRGLATNALSFIDSMDRSRHARTTAPSASAEIGEARPSSETIMPGEGGGVAASQTASSVLPSGSVITAPSISGDSAVGSGTVKAPESPNISGLLSPLPDEAARRAQQRTVELAKVRAGMQMDDNDFRHLLLESQILTQKEHTKWNLGAINELLEGPLMNPRRMEEVSRGSRFVRRLLSFFHPSEQRFALIPNTAANRKYVRLGCTMIRAFLATTEGVRVLSEDPLLREIRTALELLDPLSGGANGTSSMPLGDQTMSKGRVEGTLTYGYFEMLGILSRSHEGLDLLQKAQTFTVFYNLSGIQSRDYLIKEIIKNFDYSIDGHTRIILSKVLTSTYRNMRIFATRTLTSLIAKAVEPSQWLIALLLTQLYDTAAEVRELAVRAVMQACTSPAVLELVVSMRPTLEHLGEDSHPLLLRFMSSSSGFRYLFKGDYIIREMEDWLNVRNGRYMVQLELLLARALSLDAQREMVAQGTSGNANGVPGAAEQSVERAEAENRFAPESLWAGASSDSSFDGTVPPHFYGELAKTAEGCALLAEKGHLNEFASFIRRHGKEAEDGEIIAKLKSVLWTVGNIGANPRGLSFLEAEDIISNIVEIAERSQVLSVRGVGFFVIGMISSTPQGAEVLNDYGWRTAWTSMGLPTGVCIPDEIDRFVEIEPWTPVQGRTRNFSELMPSSDPVERDILSALSELGNRIVAKLAHRELLKIKTCYPEYFEEDFTSGGGGGGGGGDGSSPFLSFSGRNDANLTPTLGSLENSFATIEANPPPEEDEFYSTHKRLIILVRALELLDNFPLQLSMRRIVWELFDVKLDEGFVRALGRTRRRLVEDRRRWVVQQEREGGGGGGGGREWMRAMSLGGPGPGTAAYAAVVGLRPGMVAGGGGVRPGGQAQRERSKSQVQQQGEGGGGPGAAVRAKVGSVLGLGVGGVGARLRLVGGRGGVGDEEEEEEEEDDSEDDSDGDDVVGLARGVGAGGMAGVGGEGVGLGPAVVISNATYDSKEKGF
ncbi:hypothetical protein CF335_g3739 [Tilletia laevis]|nr:hypothetical protein CF335_g3739 [Tilletia laevis]